MAVRSLWLGHDPVDVVAAPRTSSAAASNAAAGSTRSSLSVGAQSNGYPARRLPMSCSTAPAPPSRAAVAAQRGQPPTWHCLRLDPGVRVRCCRLHCVEGIPALRVCVPVATVPGDQAWPSPPRPRPADVLRASNLHTTRRPSCWRAGLLLRKAQPGPEPAASPTLLLWLLSW